MNKIVIGIFAHPDDEAFGPSGTMLQHTKSGGELHLITLTAGEAGQNPDEHEDLAATRLEEWHRAGQLIGATSMHHLGFHDGQLGNQELVQSSKRIIEIINQVWRDSDQQNVGIEIISMDTNGITGHIDHIVASRAAHQAFYKLRQQGLPMTRLLLVCISRRQTGNLPNTDFVFMEPGRTDDEIDLVVDSNGYADELIEIIQAHHTQRQDAEYHVAYRQEHGFFDYFLVKE